MSNPVFLKFIGYNGKPVVVNISKVTYFCEYRSNEEVYTLLEFEREEGVLVRCSFEDVCIAVSNWCTVDGTYCK